MRSWILTFISFWLLATAVTADPSEEFSAANKAFRAEEYKKAYEGYQKLLGNGHINADLLYNLGNSSFRLGDTGEAILWFERALIVDPTHREARQNLNYLKRTSGILRFEESQLDGFLRTFRSDTLWRVATFAGWLAALGIAATLTLRLSPNTRSTLWVAIPILAILAIAAGTGIYFKNRKKTDLDSRSVVTTTDSKAFTAPARSAGSVIDLPAGTQVALVSKRGEWSYVDVPGELRGWVPEKALTQLWPYDPSLAD